MLSDESEQSGPVRLRYDLPLATRAEDSLPASAIAKRETTPCSLITCSEEQFIQAMSALSNLKRTMVFTPEQLDAWGLVLRRFPAKVLNLSVVELAVSETRFPELADLFRKCHAKMPKAYCPMGDSTDAGKPSPQLVKQIAQDMGLDVD